MLLFSKIRLPQQKRIFSINVQAICDHDLTLTNVVARWPGSTHDSRIFENSNICARIYNTYDIRNSVLLHILPLNFLSFISGWKLNIFLLVEETGVAGNVFLVTIQTYYWMSVVGVAIVC
jgi:hypothetical protein